MLCGLLAPAAGQAQPLDEGIDPLLQRAFSLRQEGRDDEARQVLERALQRLRAPRVLAQLSQAEQATGHWIEADQHLREALSAEGDPWIDRNRAALRAAQAVIDAHLGNLLIRGGPTGATVHVDGREVAQLPMRGPARVRVGRVAVEIAAPGYLAVQRVIEVAPGGTARDEVFLMPLRAPVDAPAASHLAPEPHRAPPALPPPERFETQRTFAWITLLGATLGVGLGTTGLLLRERAVTRFNSNPGCSVTEAGVFGGPDCQVEYTSGADMGYLAIGGFVTAGVLGVSSALLFYSLPASRDRGHGRAGCAPWLDAVHRGGTCVVSF